VSHTRSRLGHPYNKSVKNRTRMQLRSGTVLSQVPVPVRTRVQPLLKPVFGAACFGFTWPRPGDCPSIKATTFSEIVVFCYDQLKSCDPNDKHQGRRVTLSVAETLMRSDRELIQTSFVPMVTTILDKLREASLAACNPPDLCAYIKVLERTLVRDAGEYVSYSPCDPFRNEDRIKSLIYS
jgi:hypothetical protein